jgi:hypothetical protein
VNSSPTLPYTDTPALPYTDTPALPYNRHTRPAVQQTHPPCRTQTHPLCPVNSWNCRMICLKRRRRRSYLAFGKKRLAKKCTLTRAAYRFQFPDHILFYGVSTFTYKLALRRTALWPAHLETAEKLRFYPRYVRAYLSGRSAIGNTVLELQSDRSHGGLKNWWLRELFNDTRSVQTLQMIVTFVARSTIRASASYVRANTIHMRQPSPSLAVITTYNSSDLLFVHVSTL